MDAGRFDRFCRRFAARGLSRRHALRGLGALGIASALVGLQRQPAAADCPDITFCEFDCNTCPLEMGVPNFPLPGGPVGTCWDWRSFSCLPCDSSKSWASLRLACNQANAGCNGYCEARF
jgi:hypothetical protein